MTVTASSPSEYLVRRDGVPAVVAGVGATVGAWLAAAPVTNRAIKPRRAADGGNMLAVDARVATPPTVSRRWPIACLLFSADDDAGSLMRRTRRSSYRAVTVGMVVLPMLRRAYMYACLMFAREQAHDGLS